jgi:hypothetical protein
MSHGFTVSFERACQPFAASAAQLEKVEAELRAASVDYGYRQDPFSGEITVLAEPNDVEVVKETLEGSESVDIELADQPASRDIDSNPHWGGAGIRPQGQNPPVLINGNYCTSGFAIRWNGGNWMAAAAHCSDDYGPFWNTGSTGVYYGVERQLFRFQDVMLLGSSNQTYERRIHTDPCGASACSRLVTARGPAPFNGMGICTSGMVTRAVCGGWVDNAQSFTECSGGTCIRRWVGIKPGSQITTGGDSGGPVYGRNSTTTADIRGMIIANLTNPDRTRRTDTSVFTAVRDVEAVVGGTLITS